jgi:Tfp pilus assembly protein PilN
MDIQINLLPDELRPKPPVEMKNLLLVVLVVALLAGSVFLYMSKANATSDRIDMEERTAAVTREAQALGSDPEAVALNQSITRLKAVEKNYSSFVATRIDWGDAVDRVNALVPQGIQITKLTQAGATLKIEGTTSGYSAVASYGRALDIDGKFVLAGVPFLNGSSFSLVIFVAGGGGS